MENISEVPPVFGDPGGLQQVVVNLVTNAAQAIDGGIGRITVSVLGISETASAPHRDRTGPAVRLSIADTGCGMDEAILERIFEPFFTTREVGEGTGLGLSVVHGIVAGHGGNIAVESRLGYGTRFDIYLPTAVEMPIQAELHSPNK